MGFSIDWPSCSLSTTALALRAMHDMLVKRRKKVSKARVLAFTKRLSSLALQQDHGGAAGCMVLLRALHTTFPATATLLDPEHEVGSGVFDPTLSDPEHCCASNTTAWEHAVLASHYHPIVSRLSGEASLPPALKMRETEVVEAYSMQEMAFNPPVEPPAKRAKKKARGCPVSESFLTIPSVSNSINVDFHAAAVSKQ